jgi:hypothetical protein
MLLFIGLKLGFDISESQKDQSQSVSNFVALEIINKLREAKTMRDSGILSKEKYLRYREEILGLVDNNVKSSVEQAQYNVGDRAITLDVQRAKDNVHNQINNALSSIVTSKQENPKLLEKASNNNVNNKNPKTHKNNKVVEGGNNKDNSRDKKVEDNEGNSDDMLSVERREWKMNKLMDALKPQLLASPKDMGVPGKYDFAGQSVNKPDESFPAIKGVAYDPNKHIAQGGSVLISSCHDREVDYKFIFIKTHKTGSSTITNLFHRFAYKYGLNVALPRDNMFYGWPSKGMASVTSIEEIGVYKPPFDVYASAHSIFSPDAQSKIVPGAQYVTILRSPMSHFRSAFRYWQIGQSIMRHGFKGTGDNGLITPEDFFENPTQTALYHKKLGMTGLIYNSFSYDLGIMTDKDIQALKNSPTKLQAKIEELEELFTTVVITDYMEESLLLLKRDHCWQLDDVVIGAMKVTPRKPGSPEPPMKTKAFYMQDPLFKNVVDYNWLDTALYDHFNNSLWTRIQEEKQLGENSASGLTWDEELAELKARVAAFTKNCGPLNYQHEDRHRAELEKSYLPDAERLCHLAYTDSKGYCKTFKREQGGKLDVLECYAQRRLTRWSILRLGNGADEALSNVMALQANLHGQMLRTRDRENSYVFTPLANDPSVNGDAMRTDPLTGKKVFVSRNPKTYSQSRKGYGGDSMSAVRGLRFSKKTFDYMGGSASMFSFVAQHPVQDFADAWKTLEISERLAAAEKTSELQTMEEFFAKTTLLKDQKSRLRAAMDIPLSDNTRNVVAKDGFCAFQLINRLGCRFGFNPFDELEKREHPHKFRQLYRQHRTNLFQVPLLAEYMVESLILIRQTICWRTNDFESINVKLWQSAQLSDPSLKDESSTLRLAIEKLLVMDMVLYIEMERTFWLKLAQRPGTIEELPIMEEAIRQHAIVCPTSKANEILAKASEKLSKIEKTCLLSSSNEESFIPILNGPSSKRTLTVSQFPSNDPCAQALDILACERENNIHN